mmetsp:Transcript_60704/g.180809  ORF Transcript_60704/g.180809 Transcript_60704/m.180809 type:complete len:266 (+) Transcript_60704:1249-2046(+)
MEPGHRDHRGAEGLKEDIPAHSDPRHGPEGRGRRAKLAPPARGGRVPGPGGAAAGARGAGCSRRGLRARRPGRERGPCARDAGGRCRPLGAPAGLQPQGSARRHLCQGPRRCGHEPRGPAGRGHGALGARAQRAAGEAHAAGLWPSAPVPRRLQAGRRGPEAVRRGDPRDLGVLPGSAGAAPQGQRGVRPRAAAESGQGRPCLPGKGGRRGRVQGGGGRGRWFQGADQAHDKGRRDGAARARVGDDLGRAEGNHGQAQGDKHQQD